MAESLSFRLKMLVTPQLFVGSLPVVDVYVDPDPVKKRPIECPEGLWAAEVPSIFSFRTSDPARTLASGSRAVAFGAYSERRFMIIGVYQLDVSIPRHIDGHSKPKRII